MKKLATSILRLGTETGFAVAPQIAALEAQGWNIVKLTLGEPGGNMPTLATEEAKASIDRHETHYTPSQGLVELREAIATYMSITRKVDYKPEDIVITPGGKPVIATTIMTCVEPQDEVLLPTPGYPIYESMTKYIGGKPVYIPLMEERAFRIDIDALQNNLISAKTKLLILNSPSNPTGGVLTKSDLRAIAELAVDYDFYVLADEIYSRIIYSEYDKINYYDNELRLAPSIVAYDGMPERTMILDGFSKTYAMTGMRIGFGCSKNTELIKYLTQLAINYWSCVPQPTQQAALATLGKDQSEAESMRQTYEQNRELVVRELNSITGVKCIKPDGAFYCFPNVTEVCKNLGLTDAEALRKYLLTYDSEHNRGVAVLSRIHFGSRLPAETEEYIRISFAGERSALIEGLRRLKTAIEEQSRAK